MIYGVEVTLTVYYQIEAADEDSAREIAADYIHENKLNGAAKEIVDVRVEAIDA